VGKAKKAEHFFCHDFFATFCIKAKSRKHEPKEMLKQLSQIPYY